jgi:hypothetical protein
MKDNAAFKETLKAAELFKNSYNNHRSLLSSSNMNKGRKKINKCKELKNI